MKKVLAIAAVAALTAGVSAYAANPFSDVTPKTGLIRQLKTCPNRASLKAIRMAPSRAKETSPVMKWLRSLPACSLKKIS